MGDAQALIPPSAVVMERLAVAANEVDILRDLLKVSVKMEKEQGRRAAGGNGVHRMAFPNREAACV